MSLGIDAYYEGIERNVYEKSGRQICRPLEGKGALLENFDKRHSDIKAGTRKSISQPKKNGFDNEFKLSALKIVID